MPEVFKVSDDVTVEKGDNDEFIVSIWGTVDVIDKERQNLPVIDELLKDLPMMMAHKPKVHLSHTDTEVGDLVDCRVSNKTLEDGTTVPGVITKSSIYGARRFHKAVRTKILKGELGMMSIKGFAYKKDVKKDVTGQTYEVLRDIEAVTFALCKTGMNPEATMIDINGKSFEKSSPDLDLLKNEDFHRHVQTYMKDGLSYRSAIDAAKEIVSTAVHKEMEGLLEPLDIIKDTGDTMPDEKEIEALKKSVEDANKKVDDLTKERDSLKAELEKAKEPSPPVQALTKEEVTTMVKAETENIRKGLIEEMKKSPDEFMKALGFQKATTPSQPQSMTEMMKTMKGDDLTGFYNMMQKARDQALNQDLGDIPDDLEKAYVEG